MTTTTDIAESYIRTITAEELLRRWSEVNERGDGDIWGDEGYSVEEGIDSEGALEVDADIDRDGSRAAILGGDLYLVCDVHGPVAVRVATSAEIQTLVGKREYGAGRDIVVKLRATEGERDAWDAAVARTSLNRSEWLRMLANEAAARRWREEDRVEGGDTADDYDRGTVLEVHEDGYVTVGWDSQTRARHHGSELRAERHDAWRGWVDEEPDVVVLVRADDDDEARALAAVELGRDVDEVVVASA